MNWKTNGEQGMRWLNNFMEHSHGINWKRFEQRVEAYNKMKEYIAEHGGTVYINEHGEPCMMFTMHIEIEPLWMYKLRSWFKKIWR